MSTRRWSRRKFLKRASAASAVMAAGGMIQVEHARGEATTTQGAATGEFCADFRKLPDRVWLGPELWANPMEDWRIADGRIECMSAGGDRNVHVLTRELVAGGGFEMLMRCGIIERGEHVSVGFRVGIHDQINDYRGNCFFGKGIDAGIANGELVLGERRARLSAATSYKELALQLVCEPGGPLTLMATDAETGKLLGSISGSAPAEALVGNIAIVNNFDPAEKNGSRFWFNDWRISGEKVATHPERSLGPILWAMHTLSDSRGEEGFVLKMTAQLPPLGAGQGEPVVLQVQRGGKWEKLSEAKIDADARTATFRVARWDASVDTPYRIVFGESQYAGTVRKQPIGRPLVLGALTCQFHTAFPYAPLMESLRKHDPDMLFFSGDQIYEQNGGYGIVRRPAGRAILNYLRKFYMFGWAFGDLMRDRPTVCLPDDHDVFQGNLWGEGGKPMAGANASSLGGYIEAPRVVEVMHKTNCSHLPDPVDPAPVAQGISVYFTHLVYGRVSFAIIGDRQFKSGPEHVNANAPRADHVRDKDFDVKSLDKPGLAMLGERQEKFLEQWARDWRGADLKVLLSETVFANVATHHGEHDGFLQADLDSNGWPQTARNRALAIIRKSFALHVNGDQHIASLVQYGIAKQRDAGWSFCPPAISVGYQRWWRPDEIGRKHENRPKHALADTGEYLDGLGNLVFVYAIANPPGSKDENRYKQADVKGSGFGLVRIDAKARTYACEAYSFLAGKPFAGWPLTIEQAENYGGQRPGKLPKCDAPDGVKEAVVIVTKQPGDELVYALRTSGGSCEPFVFEKGTYAVRIGDPDTDRWKEIKDLKVS